MSHLLNKKLKVWWEKNSLKAKRACSFIREFRVHDRRAGTGQPKFETKIWKCSGSKKKSNSFKTVTFSGFEASRFTLSRPVYISHRGVGDGWEDVQLPTQLLTDQLTLSQPEEADCPPRFR